MVSLFWHYGSVLVYYMAAVLILLLFEFLQISSQKHVVLNIFRRHLGSMDVKFGKRIYDHMAAILKYLK